MSAAAARLRDVFGLDFGRTLRRPMLWTLLALLAFLTWGLSTGSMKMSSGALIVGGRKTWITSELSVAFYLSMVVPMLYAFFASVLAGQSVIDDAEERVDELLHSTPLTPGEYVWGKAGAIAAVFGLVLAVHLGLMGFFNHLLPNAEAAEIRGPFELGNYLWPALVFAVPTILFFVGLAFWLGERRRRPADAFLLPVAILATCGFFLWNWSPGWLDPAVNRLLMLIDPAGVRWLSETWIKVDRGAEVYNTAGLGVDLPFALSRLAFAGIGIAGVAFAHRHFARTLRGDRASGARRRSRLLTRLLDRIRGRRPAAAAAAGSVEQAAVAGTRPLPAGGREPAGFWRSFARVAAGEANGLAHQPGMWLFLFWVAVQTLGTSLINIGPFQTRLLVTPGLVVARSFNTLSLLGCFLVLYFLVESLERERATRIAPLTYGSPLPTTALVAGKIAGNAAVGGVLAAAVVIGGAVAMAIEGTVPWSAAPFLRVWGLLLMPTLLAWTCFIAATWALTRNRYTTHAVGVAVITVTLYRQLTDRMSWAGNWLLWNGARQSELSVFELDRPALALNRAAVLAVAALCFVVAVRCFPRRRPDALRLVDRLRPGALARRVLRYAPWAAVPVALVAALWLTVHAGAGGAVAEKADHDYWQQNVATWKDAPEPAIAAVDIDLDLEPAERRLHSRGSFRLTNPWEEPMRRFALTGGRSWSGLSWTLDGRPFEPENRSDLYVFERPLAPGEGVVVGFDFVNRVPGGVSKNGGELPEFVLPSGVVLTAFRPTFAPLVGFDEDRGVDDDNRADPEDYPDDVWRDTLPAAFGNQFPFTTRIRVTAPAELTVNGVGTLESETAEGGRRTAVWVSEEPVRLFNVVAGRWQVRRGEGTAIFYDPRHAYNVEEMSRVLDGARRWYSEWFYPYPWREMKLSEFPALANYAQGFATNITFSEGIGFLTKPDPKADAVLVVTAHESAHQWWGNLLTPGDGPGGNLLSEGMAHFSTLLLAQQLDGEPARRQMARRFEERYAESRRADAERPLVRTDGSQPGDTVVTYEKAGWVMWMLMERMGREPLLAGLREFIGQRMNGPDYPLLEDMLATLRPHAADPEGFDRFVDTWFFRVEVPEYGLADARTEPLAGGRWRTTATVRNLGGAAMPVEVAAADGDRVDGDGKPVESYRDARATVTPAGGGEARVEIVSAFRPDRLVVDPDVEVLQLSRSAAEVEL